MLLNSRPWLVVLLTVGLAACAPKSPAPAPTPPSPADAPAAPAPAEIPAMVAGADGTLQVGNPLGKQVTATKTTDPAAGTAEAALLGILNHQAASGDFDGFLAFMHPSTKSEALQLQSLEAYQYKSSAGTTAAKCVHDFGHSIIVTAQKPVTVGVEGGGNAGVKLFVWCGAERMPVPFTVYPDGDVQRITKFGLN